MIQSTPIVFGEVLFDYFPDGQRVLGGAPFNVAWHLQALGASPLFIGRVGNDSDGNEIRQRMADWGMAVTGLQTDPDLSTGRVTVSLGQGGQPTFNIIPDQAYDRVDAQSLPELPQPVGLVYHGTLALRDQRAAETFSVLRRMADAPTFLDVNLRPPWWTQISTISHMEQARWVKINDEELTRLFPGHSEFTELAQSVRREMDLELLVVTMGARGALAVGSTGDTVHVAPKTGVQVVDTVGAGDAFAAMTILGLIRQWPLKTTLERAQTFASAIVGQQGATMDDQTGYAQFLR